MAVIGFNFTKMMIEKKKPVKGNINISNNVAIKNVSETKLAINSDKSALKFSFVYTSKYEPGIGDIELLGELILLEEKKKAKEILSSWKKKKVIPKETMTNIMNNMLNKCNVQALILSKDMNLPAPIPLPKIK